MILRRSSMPGEHVGIMYLSSDIFNSQASKPPQIDCDLTLLNLGHII